MKKNINYFLGTFLVLLLTVSSCTKDSYSLGDLTAPSNIVVTAVPVGQDATHPDGDGSGDVKITITATNALGYKVDYDASDAENWVVLPSNSVTKKFDAHLGVATYRITVVVFGPGGTTSVVTKEITVRYDYSPDPLIVTALTNDTSKTWAVDNSVAGHFGVGPWDPTNTTPSWWAAGVDEKITDAPCLYSSRFTFAKVAATGTYTLTVATPDGAYTKTGTLAGGLPGIPASGNEGCYTYGGGTAAFTFGGSTSGVAASAPSTNTSINLAGVNTFIGYGATQKEYEILTITPTEMYLRVQGTETGNAWYLKLVPKP